MHKHIASDPNGVLTRKSKETPLPIFIDTRPDTPHEQHGGTTNKASQMENIAVRKGDQDVLCSVLMQQKIASCKEEAMAKLKTEALLRANITR